MLTIWVLYRIVNPDLSEPKEAEYYQLRVETRLSNDTSDRDFLVQEKHAYYDAKAAGSREMIPTITFSPEEAKTSTEGVEAWLRDQARNRASDGFVHVFWLKRTQGQMYRNLSNVSPDEFHEIFGI